MTALKPRLAALARSAAIVTGSLLAMLGAPIGPANAETLLDLLRQPDVVAPDTPSAEPCDSASFISLDSVASNAQLSIQLEGYCIEAGPDDATRLVVRGWVRNGSPAKAMMLSPPGAMLVLQLDGGRLAPALAPDPSADKRFTARPLQPLDRRKFTTAYSIPTGLGEAKLVHPAEAGVLSLPLFPRPRPEENVVTAVEWSGLSIAATGVVETAAFGDEAPPPARHFVTVSLRIENKLKKSQTLVLSDFVEARSTPSTAARPISLHSTLGQGSTLFPGVPVTGTLVFEVDDGASPVALTFDDGATRAELPLVLDSSLIELRFETDPVYARRPITVAFAGMPGNPEDWLAIASAGSPDDKYIEAISLAGAREGHAAFGGFSEGDYELRAYFNWPDNAYRVERRIAFTVSAAPPIIPGTLLSVPRKEVASDEPVTVVWDEFPGLDRDWISIAPVGTPDTVDGIDYLTLRGRTSGRKMFGPLPVGEYEVRAYFGGERIVQDRLSVSVVSPRFEHSIRDDAALPDLVNVAHVERGALTRVGSNHDLMGDGNAIDYDGSAGFATLGADWPSRVWLAHPFPIERVRFLLWDLEPRAYRFVLRGTADGVTWVTLADHSAQPVSGGWQEFDMEGKSFIGFSLESTSADGQENGFGVVEFAAYASTVTPDPDVDLPAGEWSDWIDQIPDTPINVAVPALGATAESRWGGHLAIDGRRDFYSAEVSMAQPLSVTLSDVFPIETIRVEIEEGRRPVGWRLEGSIDGSSFSTIAEFSEPRDGSVEIETGGMRLQTLRVAPMHDEGAILLVREIEVLASGPSPVTGVATALPNRELTAGRNLALAQNGGRIAAVSSERNSLRRAHNLIDGRIAKDWNSALTKFPEEVVLALGGRPGALVDAIDFYASSAGFAPRLVDIALASESGDWQEVGRYALYDKLASQRVSFEAREVRLVRLRFVSGFDRERVGLGEIVVREARKAGYESAAATHWPTFRGGLNIAAAALGGRIVSASPIDPDPNYPPSRLIDGYGAKGGTWALHNDPAVAQVTLAFADGQAATIAGVAFNPDGGYSNFTGAQRWTSIAEVWASAATDGTSGFEWVGRYRLDQSSETQIFSFAPRSARYVRVLLLDTFGEPGAVMGEIEVLEKPGTSILEARPPNLLDLTFGGHLVVPAGRNRSHLIDSTSASDGWFDESGARPVALTFAFKVGEARTFDAVALNPRTALDPHTWARRAKILVSDHPLRDFRLLADVDLDPIDRLQYFPLGVVTARYVQLRLLDNGGDPIMSLGEVAVREAIAEGALSVLARTDEETAMPVDPDVEIVPFTGDHREHEPNGSTGEATSLPLGESMVGEISPLTDEDWYEFDASLVASGAVNARVEELPTLQSELSLFGADGVPLGTQRLYDVGRSSADFTWLVAPQRHNLRLRRAQNSIVFIVDRSGSVDSARGAIAQAAVRFAENATADDAISFTTMDGEIFNDFSSDKTVLDEAARRTGTGTGGSGVYGALSAALDRLAEREGAKAIVIVTDGEDSGSSMEPLFALWDKLEGTSARIYTVGFGPAVTTPLDGLLASTGGDMLHEFSAATGGKFFLAPSGAAMRDIYARISSDFRSESGYRLTVSPSDGMGQLEILTEGEEITGVGAPRQVGLVFDASGSMKTVLENGVSRMEVARDTLNALVDRLPDATEVALAVYGHRLPSRPHEESCRDIELMVPFSPLDRERMHGIIDGIQPRGETPIGRSLLAMSQSFDPLSSKKFVILITDGEESCDPAPDDPAYPPRVIEALRSQGIELTLSIVGFTIDDEATRAFLQELASGTGGGYYDAADREALDSALKQAFSAGFTVLDSLGAEAATGRVGAGPSPLPAGSWHIVLESDPPLDLGIHEVAAGAATTVTLTREGDRVDVNSTR